MTEAEQAVIAKHWEVETAKGLVPVYSHGVEILGVPTLSTMSLLAKGLKSEVVHYGYGCFGAKRDGVQLFTFDGGGAMQSLLYEGKRFASWSYFSGTKEAYTALLNLIGKDYSSTPGHTGVRRAMEILKLLDKAV